MRWLLVVALVACVGGSARTARAAAPALNVFLSTWQRTDKPIADGRVSRTWMWGPEAFSAIKLESADEAEHGTRMVQYFDKSRMEVNDPEGDRTSPWFVTNGLLSTEMITGQIQVGAARFVSKPPATVNVAGDAGANTGPTYAALHFVLHAPPLADGAVITQAIARNGYVTDKPSTAAYNVRVAYRVQVPGLDHQVAAPFWEFMNSSGLVYEQAQYTTAPLFLNPFYATGYPIIEPYWARVTVAGTSKEVLIQCFERRCLTYTPDNPSGWQVEAGNVGQHYYQWRYGSLPRSTAQFSDGTYRVGAQLPAGTYRNVYSGGGCYWERLRGFGGTFDEIIANEFTSRPTIVTISAGDVGFSSNDCLVWSADLTPYRPDPGSPFTSGMYFVGSEITPGTWEAVGGESCYWERLSGFSGDFHDIIGNHYGGGQQIVQIGRSDAGFASNDCGTWRRVSNAIAIE